MFVPPDLKAGDYDVQIGIVGPSTRAPKVRLAIAGVEKDGWYGLGKLRVE